MIFRECDGPEGLGVVFGCGGTADDCGVEVESVIVYAVLRCMCEVYGLLKVLCLVWFLVQCRMVNGGNRVFSRRYSQSLVMTKAHGCSGICSHEVESGPCY